MENIAAIFWLFLLPFVFAGMICYRQSGLLTLSEVVAVIGTFPRVVVEPYRAFPEFSLPLKVMTLLLWVPGALLIGVPILLLTVPCMLVLGVIGSVLRAFPGKWSFRRLLAWVRG